MTRPAASFGGRRSGRAFTLALAAIAWGAAPVSSTAWQTPESVLDLTDAHELRVTLERLEDFRAGWIDARPELRERALDRLRAYREPAAPPWADPLFPVLCEARYLLSGGTIESYPGLQRVADLLDLRLVPGAFEARSGGPRQPITVRVAPLDYTDPPRVNRVKLYWVSPDGIEQRVRDEQVLRPALQPPGFEMYIHAPSSRASEWTLVAEVRAGNAWGRTSPVRVSCVRDLHERIARARARPSDTLAVAALDAVDVGLRPPPGVSVATLLTASGIEARTGAEQPAPAVLPRPWAEFEGAPVWELDGAPQRAERAVLLLGSFEQPPEARITGTRGAAWAEAARTADLIVLSTRTVLGAERLAAIRARLERERGVRKLILVALGAAVPDATTLRPWLPGSPVDGLVLSTALIAGTRPPRVLPLPTLVLDAVADVDSLEVLVAAADGGSGARDAAGGTRPARTTPARTTWVQRRELPFTAELVLPGLLVDWMATEPALSTTAEPTDERPR